MLAPARDGILNALAKNLRIFRAFALASLQADLEYRANFLSRIVTDVFWYVAQIITFETLFVHTPTIGSWDRTQTRVFLGVLFVVDAIYMILFHDNLDRMSEKVRKGDLDFILAKPVSSRLMVSCQRMATAHFGNLFIGFGWLVWSMSQLPELSLYRLLWLLMLVPCGLTILYCVRFGFATVAIILTRAEAIQYIWYNIYKFGMRPDSIYSPWLRYILMSLLPVAMISSVPARALLDPPDYPLFFYSVGLAFVLFYLSGRFWRFALGRYTSASS